ncbi:hypothetical protein FPZ43_12915 [Mucilaginibacter pallidiroseus]|uniref:Uncharacterized protein n=1 Tax=Mucilaginibacter pallidiroseus TaxID=2599295 RepID=A0A563U7R7_9SPHI|nr:hypothetical protein [Mucilaginibacter pallidiroseus]TWR27378.1 hypothetical protein FPZ43_12915 [Mucilaginibacter pallidiroseus]
MNPSTQNANSESHYKLLVVAIAIGLVGVFLRFADFGLASTLSNIILVIGVIVALKGVFAILD